MTSDVKDKDVWDKAEALSKVVSSVLIPLVVAIALWSWNSERTQQQTASAMTEIAVGILTGEPSTETEPLRAWAVSVLQSPSDPPNLSDEAASTLQGIELDVWGVRSSEIFSKLKVDDWRLSSSAEIQSNRTGWLELLALSRGDEGTTFGPLGEGLIRGLIEDMEIELSRRSLQDE